MLFQYDPFNFLLWIIIFFIIFVFGQRIMLAQYLMRLENAAVKLEERVRKSKEYIIRRVRKRPERKLRAAISSFLEFFVIEPVMLDPYGIIEKLEHIINLVENKMKTFVKQIAGHLNSEERANIMASLSSAIYLNQLSKIVRHYVELVKKTKSVQLALLFQMQLPLIDRISKALLNGTEALTKGWPIGDSIGSLIVAKLIGDSKYKEKNETIICRKKIEGKNVILVKAKGPGGRIGKIGRVVEGIIKREKISRVITIDAAQKLEGERTGSVAEGIGVAIGGIGTDKAFIENIAIKRKIELDSIIIKMSAEESIQPMKREILDSVGKVIDLIKERVRSAKGKVLIVGVGNTVGIGNSEKDALKAEEKIREVIKLMKMREEIEKKRKKWFQFGI